MWRRAARCRRCRHTNSPRRTSIHALVLVARTAGAMEDDDNGGAVGGDDSNDANAVAAVADIGATVAGGTSVIVMPSLAVATVGLEKAAFILAVAPSSVMLDCDTSTYASMMTEPARISR